MGTGGSCSYCDMLKLCVVLGGSMLWRCCVRQVCAVGGGSKYVWPNYRPKLLQLLSGRVLGVGNMCLSGSLSEGVLGVEL